MPGRAASACPGKSTRPAWRPDMLFVPVLALGGVTNRGIETVPGLVVEVVSPHSRRIDREKKPPRYREFGVPEYWVVDPEARAVEAYRFAAGAAEPEVGRDTLLWQPRPERAPLELHLPELFSDEP